MVTGMITHSPVLPVVLPALAGVLLIFLSGRSETARRAVSLGATILLVALGLHLAQQASGGERVVYELGAWPAPFGIVLVVDRLSAYMVLLTSIVAAVSLLAAIPRWDQLSKNFHAIFQFQLMGLNIAFLTGDVFNLFVAFEVLLIASYGLLVHGGGATRSRAGLHYVVLNLVGSALFLLAVGLIYGVTGTLNMADLAVKAAQVSGSDAQLLRIGGLLLLTVFAIKAAVLPLYFWLPSAYSAATPPVAALFAVMTKVGVYAILRVYTLCFGSSAGELVNLAEPILLPVALATLVAGTLGALAARSLRILVSYLTIASIGTLLVAVGLFSTASMTAALYYLVHSTLVSAVLFLIAGEVVSHRGKHADQLQVGPRIANQAILGLLFFAAAIAMAGLPPLSGFLGKLMILQSTGSWQQTGWVWSVILATGLLMIISLSRAGSVLFWKSDQPVIAKAPRPALAPITCLLTLLILLSIFAEPATTLARATADQLLDPAGYIEAVLGTERALEAQSLALPIEEQSP